MAGTIKVSALEGILHRKEIIPKLFSVKTLSKDLAVGYQSLKEKCFMNATSVADKFHVI